MKRKIALAIGTSLLCIAILTGCNSSVAAEDAFSAANSGDTENAQKLYTNIIDNSSEQKEQLNKLLSAEFEQLLDNYNHEELTDDQAKEEFKKYSEAFEGIESVETARENLKELIDSKKSFKSAKESEAEENYGRAYAECRHVSALDINYDEAQKQMDVCLSAFESEILRLCEEQAYYKAISNTIDLMEELGISMPMSDDDTLGIDDCFLFIAKQMAESCGFENAQASMQENIANGRFHDHFYDINIGCDSLNGTSLERISNKKIIDSYAQLDSLFNDTFMTACVFKGFYITLGDIHSNGKWYDVFICDGMESDVTVRSDAERGPFNATMKSKFDNWGKSSNNSTKNNESTSGGNVTQEYLNALNRGLSYAQNLHMSKKAVYDQLTSSYGEGFPADAAQYAIDNMTGIDWNANTLEKAKQYYYNMSMSKSAVYDQLTSEYGEQFTTSEAQYAIDHLN